MTRVSKLSYFLLLTCTILQYGSGGYIEGTVYLDKGKPSFVPGKIDTNGAAYGTYNNTLFTTGWGVLDIKAGFGKTPIENADMAFAAGYFEGVVTSLQIWQQYQNMYPIFLSDKSAEVVNKTKKFFNEQDSWMRMMIKEKAATDASWRHMSYIVAQYDGLYAGYKSVAKSDWNTDVFVVQLLNGNGDLIDLIKAISPSARPNFNKMNKDELFTYVSTQGHCSALVKVTGAYENIFMSHSSWFTYSATDRIYKHYSFNFQDEATAAKDLSFSSYPGFLESLDDFYILGSKMVLLQTTNNVFNTSLYDFVQPNTLLAWHRVRLASFMAHGGREWAEIFSRYNSGTYNNQYMVVDLKKIELKKGIHDDALWVVEQIPTKVAAGDMTPMLRAGYWPSYNVPFFESIYNLSGYPSFVELHGLGYSYQLAPRAKIFRRDQANVSSIDGMKYIMRYNDYENDPYSEGNPCNTICCRGDLDSKNPRPDGCYDSKVTDYNMALNRQSFAISGPTMGTNLKPFKWSEKFAKYSHIGLPDSYTFPWVFMSPKQ